MTFIQMLRKGGDKETCGEVQRQGDTEWVVPHPHVVDKNQEGYLRGEGTETHTRPSSPGFQCQGLLFLALGVGPHNFCLKPSRELGRETERFSGVSC